MWCNHPLNYLPMTYFVNHLHYSFNVIFGSTSCFCSDRSRHHFAYFNTSIETWEQYTKHLPPLLNALTRGACRLKISIYYPGLFIDLSKGNIHMKSKINYIFKFFIYVVYEYRDYLASMIISSLNMQQLMG